MDKALFLDPATIGSYGEERILQDGDLLWNSTGLGTLGRMAIYDSKADGSTKQKELATKTIKSYLVPLPPLPEQQRIIKQVQELIGLLK